MNVALQDNNRNAAKLRCQLWKLRLPLSREAINIWKLLAKSNVVRLAKKPNWVKLRGQLWKLRLPRGGRGSR